MRRSGVRISSQAPVPLSISARPPKGFSVEETAVNIPKSRGDVEPRKAGNMKSFVRVGVVIAAATIPLFGLSAGAASAKAKAAPKAKTPSITVTASPNPVVETDTSNFLDVIQVEAKGPVSPGDTVTISSTELFSNCTTIDFF